MTLLSYNWLPLETQYPFSLSCHSCANFLFLCKNAKHSQVQTKLFNYLSHANTLFTILLSISLASWIYWAPAGEIRTGRRVDISSLCPLLTFPILLLRMQFITNARLEDKSWWQTDGQTVAMGYWTAALIRLPWVERPVNQPWLLSTPWRQSYLNAAHTMQLVKKSFDNF